MKIRTIDHENKKFISITGFILVGVLLSWTWSAIKYRVEHWVAQRTGPFGYEYVGKIGPYRLYRGDNAQQNLWAIIRDEKVVVSESSEEYPFFKSVTWFYENRPIATLFNNGSPKGPVLAYTTYNGNVRGCTLFDVGLRGDFSVRAFLGNPQTIQINENGVWRDFIKGRDVLPFDLPGVKSAEATPGHGLPQLFRDK